jgi:hypothetical protein
MLQYRLDSAGSEWNPTVTFLAVNYKIFEFNNIKEFNEGLSGVSQLFEVQVQVLVCLATGP